MNSILIGKIVNVHGIKGEVKVYPYTDDMENLTNIKSVYFDEDMTKKCKVKLCRIHKNMLIVISVLIVGIRKYGRVLTNTSDTN